ncbi:SDR family NAD(P)-dependent oxidoreductase [Sinomicrobium soli]|uniref:SDR family NAD(P)-dependent oxidoreductase n=1 Tax=Sinomicrobium sp. N-1-3-6 TaxID=2219864 RepID=UPI000DCE6FB9|nr:SDR family oxidoreductase [Sinomicrobium sp. N-1-3-6]RAV27778.1 short-chain dehydrogenase [Sinomicrobium sp. N-1-3-6]
MTKFPYKTALITGASSGIGKIFAYELAKKGINLVLTARSENKLSQISSDLISKFEIKVSYIIADLSNPTSAKTIVDQLINKNIMVDLLVNNAGIGQWANFLDESMETYTSTIHLNITSLVSLTHLLLPQMLHHKNGGIVNIASGAALQPGPYMAVYAASKAFVLSFSEALYGEYVDKGITVTAICPGNTPTEFQKTANANTEGIPGTTPEQVVKDSVKALLKRESNKIVGTSNYLLSFVPRILPRKTVINLVKNMMNKRVNP